MSNFGGYYFDQATEYDLPDRISDNSIALSGNFVATPEYIESKDDNSVLNLKFKATEVNLVMQPADKPSALTIKFEDQTVPKDLRGKDMDPEGLVRVDRPAMYNLIKSTYPVSGTLTLQPKEGNFRAYAFNFSGCI